MTEDECFMDVVLKDDVHEAFVFRHDRLEPERRIVHSMRLLVIFAASPALC